MKKIILLVGLLIALTTKAQAIQSTVWTSSNVAVAISTTAICGQYLIGTTTATQRGILHGICINTAAAGSINVFASSFTALIGTSSTTITGVYSTATQVPCNFYDVESPTGLSYNKNGTADISILFQCY